MSEAIEVSYKNGWDVKVPPLSRQADKDFSRTFASILQDECLRSRLYDKAEIADDDVREVVARTESRIKNIIETAEALKRCREMGIIVK